MVDGSFSLKNMNEKSNKNIPLNFGKVLFLDLLSVEHTEDYKYYYEEIFKHKNRVCKLDQLVYQP